ncbi:uracil phosphoribosyltransferase isoform X3 [Setaria viridis]|uniref:uracil phosphoribosyltransferase isoform X3 n=1 Tax=Setaria viridis TaxID=4556 RepID=UPI001493CB23|nr:uracil phosphoribosyltransferase-like isoform X5 [Setaria viridis]
MQSENSRIWLVELRASRASLSTYLVACLFFAYEATRDCLPTAAREVQTPLGPAAVQSIDDAQPIMIVPILRAGLAFAEQVTSILPSARIFHPGKTHLVLIYINEGMSRNEETLLPAIYLNKLPAKFPGGCHIFLMDPMLATALVDTSNEIRVLLSCDNGRVGDLL